MLQPSAQFCYYSALWFGVNSWALFACYFLFAFIYAEVMEGKSFSFKSFFKKKKIQFGWPGTDKKSCVHWSVLYLAITASHSPSGCCWTEQWQQKLFVLLLLWRVMALVLVTCSYFLATCTENHVGYSPARVSTLMMPQGCSRKLCEVFSEL